MTAPEALAAAEAEAAPGVRPLALGVRVTAAADFKRAAERRAARATGTSSAEPAGLRREHAPLRSRHT